jgi:hypothetical protein
MRRLGVWRTTVSRVDDEQLPFFWKMAGRLDEYRELLGLLIERPGLTVLSADPWSGMSSIVRAVVSQLDDPCVLVDARASSSPLDLAMAIADEAIRSLQREAAPWWLGSAPAPSAAGLRLARKLSQEHIAFEQLRVGAGPWPERLADAVELARVLAGKPVTVVIDHAGLLLCDLPAADARELLGVLRALRQQHFDVDLVLVEHPDGRAAKALSDPEHPLFRAGQRVYFRRPEPYRFALDLEAALRPSHVEPESLSAAAELVAGVPGLAWRIVDLDARGETIEERARAGWRQLRHLTAPSVAQQWDLLRRVHPLAQPVVAAVAAGLSPHAVPANSKSVNDALRRLQCVGLAWQPAPRSWQVADPLLVAWACDRPPSWVRHRRQQLG